MTTEPKLPPNPAPKNIPPCEYRIIEDNNYVCNHHHWDLDEGLAIIPKDDCGKDCLLLKNKPNENTNSYGSIEPTEATKDLDALKEFITARFPDLWFETKACLSVCASMCQRNLSGCPSLNLVGNSSGGKTTVLSFFYGYDNTYLTDEFTPRSFVSHATNVKREELAEIDLLPKLKNKIMLTPELAPLFRADKESQLVNFSIITRVLDGEGYSRDSGTQGHRGYKGDYKFAWLGATTPLPKGVWNTMAGMGNRLFFLQLREKDNTEDKLVESFEGVPFNVKIEECRGAVRSFLDSLYLKSPLRSIEWNTSGDREVLKKIIKYSQFLAKLRATVQIYNDKQSGEIQHNFPLIEEPHRIIASFLNFARGHALTKSRNHLLDEDLEIVRAITLSSMPLDRQKFLELLMKHKGKLDTEQIERELDCSKSTATRTMKFFEVLGVVKVNSAYTEDKNYGCPMNFIEVVPEFKELITHTGGI